MLEIVVNLFLVPSRYCLSYWDWHDLCQCVPMSCRSVRIQFLWLALTDAWRRHWAIGIWSVCRRIARLVIDLLVLDWHWITGLVMHWQIGDELAMDWQISTESALDRHIGDGLADWSWIERFAEYWHLIGVRFWIGIGLAIDWWIGDGLALD